MLSNVNVPSVSVPVLSIKTVSISLAASKTSAPLNRIPSSAARPTPAVIATGVASPSEHGQATRSTAAARMSASLELWPAMNQRMKYRAAATARMRGTNTDATRSASRWILVFDVCEISIRRTIWAKRVSGPVRETSISRRPSMLIAPARTCDPGSILIGTDSPVSRDKSALE